MKKFLYLFAVILMTACSSSNDDSPKVDDFYGTYYMECTESSSIFYTKGKLYEVYLDDDKDYCTVYIFGGYGVFSSVSSSMYPSSNYNITDNSFSFANTEMRGFISLNGTGELYFTTERDGNQVSARFKRQ